MTLRPFILGIDAGFSNLGYAFFRPDLGVFVDSGLLTTAPGPNEKPFEGNPRRCALLALELQKLLLRFSPVQVCAELPLSGGRNARAVAHMSYALATVVSTIVLQRVSLHAVTPFEVKRVVTGKTSASKEEVMAFIRKQYPSLLLPAAACKAEHIADAGVAALLHPESLRYVGPPA